jgi:hypothetical protein
LGSKPIQIGARGECGNWVLGAEDEPPLRPEIGIAAFRAAEKMRGDIQALMARTMSVVPVPISKT